MKVYPLTDFPERYQALEEIFLITSSKPKSLLIEKVRFHKGCIIMKLKGYNSISEAERLKGFEIGIPEEQLWPLSGGEYYYFQLIGVRVETESGEWLGQVVEVLATGANDVYVVRGPWGEVLLPAVDDVVLELDLELKRMVVHLLPGMLAGDKG